MDGSDRLKKTSIRLYEDDVKEFERRGLSLSDVVRTIVHHIAHQDDTDIIHCIKESQHSSELSKILYEIETLEKKKSDIDRRISDLNELREQIKDRIRVEDIEMEYRLKIDEVFYLGTDIDQLIIKYEFDEDVIRKRAFKEINRMIGINPGWSLSEHIKIRKRVLSSR